MRDDVPHPPKTSVPEWDSTPPDISTSGTSYTIFSLDSDENATATGWSTELTRAGVAHDVVVVEGPALASWLATCGARFEELTASKRVGWRVAAAGDEVGVLAVGAACRRVGLIDAEITAFAESRRRWVVFCAHCKATTLACREVGVRVECQSCRRALDVRPHVSRNTGTYLGVAEPVYTVAGEPG
jgi:hypothetical protein